MSFFFYFLPFFIMCRSSQDGGKGKVALHTSARILPGEKPDVATSILSFFSSSEATCALIPGAFGAGRVLLTGKICIVALLYLRYLMAF